MTPGCSDVLVVAEYANGQPSALTYELLGLARRLGDAQSGRVLALALDSSSSPSTKELGARGADVVFAVDDSRTQSYEAERWLQAIPAVLAQHGPAHVLVGHTALGAELGPRLAFRLGTSIATGCERVELREGRLTITRPCFGSKAREVLMLKSCPSVATVRARMNDALPRSEKDADVIAVQLPSDAKAAPTTVLERKRYDPGEGSLLETAKIIVAGGRGVGGADGFRTLEKLAATVGGAVGASRVACDLGWVPQSRQIGLSGKTVSPDLYIAVGISGASQHMAGCGKARAILAINNDPEASIFKDATFGVVGDYREIVPALIEQIGSSK
jgi:electron transfer flavoprotein alpha subunit